MMKGRNKVSGTMKRGIALLLTTVLILQLTVTGIRGTAKAEEGNDNLLPNSDFEQVDGEKIKAWEGFAVNNGGGVLKAATQQGKDSSTAALISPEKIVSGGETEKSPMELDRSFIASANEDNAKTGVWTPFTDTGNIWADWSTWETEAENPTGYGYAVIEADGGKEDTGVLHFKRADMYKHIGVSIQAGLSAGQAYTIKAYVKSKMAAPYGGLCFYANSNVMVATLGDGQNVPNDGAWHEVSASFTADKTGIYMFLNGGNYASDVYVDNIRILDNCGKDMLDGAGNFCTSGQDSGSGSKPETITYKQYAMRLEGGDDALTFKPSTWYTLSYDVKCLSDEASLFSTIRQMKNSQENSNTYPWYELGNYRITGTNGDWKRVTAYFRTDSDTTRGNVWLCAADGEVLLDNVSLTEMKEEGLIPNPGFERMDATGGPADWESFAVNDGAGSISLSMGEGKDGTNAAKISPAEGKQFALRITGGDNFLSLKGNTWYILSYDVKALSDTASVYPTVRQLKGEENSSTNPFYNLANYKVTGTDGTWQRVNCYFKTDEDTTKGNFWFIAEGGEILLDNIALELMEDEGLVPNPRFERLNMIGEPADWEGFAVNNGAGSIAAVASEGPDGSSAVKISPIQGKEYALRVAGGDNALALQANTWYVLKYDAKIVAKEASVRPTIRQLNGENNSASHPFFELSGYKITGTDGRWVTVTCYFRTDKDTTSGNLWLIAEGGDVMLDNLSLNPAKKGEIPGKTEDAVTLAGEIPNPEFEYLSESGDIADWIGFGVNEGSGSVTMAFGAGVGGSNAAKISPDEGKTYALRMSKGEAPLSIKGGTWYMLTYDVKCLSDRASLRPTVRQLKGEENSSKKPWYELTEYTVTGTKGTWKTVQVYFRTDVDTTNVNFWMIAEGGAVLLDNMRLNALPSEGPVFNPGFEKTDTTGGIAGWEGFALGGGKGSVSAAIGQGVGGSNAALIHPISAHYALRTPDDLLIPVKPKTSYEVTYYVKGLTTTSKVRLTVPQKNRNGESTIENPFHELSLYAVGGQHRDFVKVKAYFRTAEDAANVLLWFDVWDGDVLVDNVSISECASDYLGDVEACNLSFEQMEQSAVKNWGAINFDSVSVNKDTYHGGKQSVNLVGSQLKEVAYFNCLEGIPVRDVDTYRFTVYVKSRNSVGARVFLTATGADKNHAVIDSVKGAETILSANSQYGEWIPVSVKYTPGADVTNVHLRIGVSKCVAADILVDDIRLLNLNEADYVEEFTSLSDSGYPEDWKTEGEAAFTADGKKLMINGKGAFVRRFLELRNNNMYQFTGKVHVANGSKAKVEIRYYDYQNQLISKQEEKISGDSFEFELETISATYAMVALCCEEGSAEFDRLQFHSVSAEVTPGAEWSGKWIWYSEDYSLSLNQPRYFRDVFELEQAPSKCIIQMTADDALNFWVNGTKIEFEDADNWEGIKLIDIAKYLVKGTNVLAFEVTNLDYECGLLYEAMPLDSKGNVMTLIISDHNTTSTKITPAANWNTAEYQEDDTWYYAKEKGRPGIQPWGLIAYDATVQSASAFELKDITIAKKVKGKTIAQAVLKVNAEHKFDKEYITWGTLWKKNTANAVCDVKLNLSVPMKEWPKNKEFEVQVSFEVPDFIPEGNYTLQLNPTVVTVVSDKYINNKICSFRVTQEKAQTGFINTSEVKTENGTVGLYLNGEEVSPMIYLPPDTYANIDSEYIYQMEKNGIGLIPIMVGSGTNGANKIWLEEQEDGSNVYDWTAYDEKIIKCIAANPNAKLLISFDASVPTWWLEKYPDDASMNKGGSSNGASFASERWREDMKQVLGDLIEHITSQTYAKYVYGLRITAGRTLEWLPWSDNICDMCPATDAAFRIWLEDKYSTNAALQKAWNNAHVTFQNATQPNVEQAASTIYGTLLDTDTQMQVIDYHKFLADTTADALIEYCQFVKEKTEGKWITGGYFGYIWNAYSYEANGTLSLSVSKVLQSDAVDYLCGPLCYDERQQGEPAPFQSMVDSLTANGKLWISENDIRTVAYQTPYSELDASAHGQTYNMSDTRSALIREFSNELIKGTGLWWYDMAGGWFNDEQIYEMLALMQEEMTANLNRTRTSASEVAVFVDEDMYAYTAYNFGPVYNWLYGGNLLQRQQLATMGVPYDLYYMSDLKRGMVPKDYKVNIILDSVEIDMEERAAIEKELKRDGKTIVWIYLPGFSDGSKMSVSNIQKVTGFDGLRLITEMNSGDSVLKSGSVYTKGVEGKTIGVREYNSVMPIVSIGDPNAEVLGTYSDGNGTSLAVKKMGDWTSIYSAVTELPAQLLTNILRQAGVHIYSDNRDDIIFANGQYLALHCRYGGEKTITLPEKQSVYDVINEKTISLNTDTITFTAEDNSTTLFRLTKADTVTLVTYVKGSGGVIKEAGMKELQPGEGGTVTFVPEEGYELVSVEVNNKAAKVKENVLTLNDVKDNTRVVAVFEKPLPTEETIEDGVQTYLIWIIIAVVAILTISGLTAYGVWNRKKRVKN